MTNCVICNSPADEECAAVLEIGIHGAPKCLCSMCSEELDMATASRDPEIAAGAIERMAKKISEGDLSSRTFEKMNSILEAAAARAKAIKDGSYDFALDDAADEDSFDEIPEELQETEEDRALDKKDEEEEEKFNRIFDYITFGVAIGIGIFVIWKIVNMFLT